MNTNKGLGMSARTSPRLSARAPACHTYPSEACSSTPGSPLLGSSAGCLMDTGRCTEASQRLGRDKRVYLSGHVISLFAFGELLRAQPTLIHLVPRSAPVEVQPKSHRSKCHADLPGTLFQWRLRKLTLLQRCTFTQLWPSCHQDRWLKCLKCQLKLRLKA